MLTFIVLVLLMIILGAVGVLWVDITGAATEAIASVQAAHIAGIINTMQTAPDRAEKTYLLPNAECEIKITPTSVFVNLPEANDRYSANLIKSDVIVDQKNIECALDGGSGIKFVKNHNRIEIIKLPVS